MSQTSFVRWFSDLGLNDVPLVGGKNASLGELYRRLSEAGVRVPTFAARSHRIEQVNIEKHLRPVFGSLLLIDLTADDIAGYQKDRLREGASPKTINLELGTLRAILRRHRIWANLQPDVKMLTVRDDVGKALTVEEETGCWRLAASPAREPSFQLLRWR